jgi:gas vesicle protein
MTSTGLDLLEREVEHARTRVAEDLARLRSPHNLDTLKQDLWAQASQTKDELVESTKDAASSATQRAIDEVKNRAMANPAAALAIGAGLAWRIYQRPPVASLLVGIGLVSLLRTSPFQSRRSRPERIADRLTGTQQDLQSQASAALESATTRAGEWTQRAGDSARDAMTSIAEGADAAADRLADAARGAATQVKEAVDHATDSASSAAQQASRMARDTVRDVSDKASSAIQEAVSDPETRDKYLLGFAALAVAAAVGIAYQRRMEQQS